jgi:hypothetical protein
MLIKNLLTKEEETHYVEDAVKWCKKRFKLRFVLYFSALVASFGLYVFK